MKNLFLALFFLILTPLISLGQNGFSVDPGFFDESFNVDINNTFEVRLDAHMTNNSDTTLIIDWQIVNIDIPTSWELSVSDIDISYFPGITNNQNPLEFSAGQTNAPYYVHLYPNEVAGCGSFDVMISLASDNSIIDSISYMVSINDDCMISGVEGAEIREEVLLFPNPFVNLLEIASDAIIDNIMLYDLQGRKLPIVLDASNIIDGTDLESGIYFIQIHLQNGDRIIKKVVKER